MSDRPEGGDALGEDPLDVGSAGDVAQDDRRRDAGVGELGVHLGCCLRVAADDDDARARLAECEGERATEAAGRSGDDGDLAVEFERVEHGGGCHGRHRDTRAARGGREDARESEPHADDGPVDGRCWNGPMPEGDTVYLAARRLDVALVGQVLTRAELRVPAHATAALAGMAVTENVTWGKHLFTRLDSGFTLHTHLRMDGTWTVLRGGRVAGRMTAPGRDTVRVLLATGGTTVVGERIPVVELIRSSTEGRVTAPLGPDPLRPDWDLAEAVRRVAADPDRDLAAVLLDQRCIAGLGNFWVNEPLLPAGLRPADPDRVRRRPRHRPAGRPCPARLGTPAADVPGHDGGHPSRPDPVDLRPGRRAVPAMRDPGEGAGGPSRRRRAPPDVVVPALPAVAG